MVASNEGIRIRGYSAPLRRIQGAVDDSFGLTKSRSDWSQRFSRNISRFLFRPEGSSQFNCLNLLPAHCAPHPRQDREHESAVRRK
ncbi:MAG: hypothetical protein CMJ77_20855 [Planctomycetaceae bacterium]|nr:hypothetical protein [Planctomycetaceae bacterium]